MICTTRARHCTGLFIAIPFILFLSCSHALAQEAGTAVDGPLGTISTIVTEDFEGAWPSGAWSTLPPGPAGCEWARSNVDADTGAWSVSPVAGGSCGANPAGPYPQNVNSWMVYGPFDLSDAATASMRFRHKLELENGADFLFVGFSTTHLEDIIFPFFMSAGGYAWTDGTVDLSPAAGNSEVWVYFVLDTDANGTSDRGVLIDNISIEKDTSLPAYDLALQSIDANQGVYLPGATVGVQATIENVSAEPSVGFRINYYLSADSAISDTDISLGGLDRPALGAGEQSNSGISLNIPGDTTNGQYFLGAILDLVDANAANNVNHDATPITVSDDPEIRVRPSALTFTEQAQSQTLHVESAAAPEQRQRERTEAILPSLRSKAARDGRVRVLVGLEIPFWPEGRLSAARVASQRASIRNRQQELGDSLAGLGAVEKARFQYIPYVALNVSERALNHLANSPLVRSIEEDVLSKPAMASSNVVIGSPLSWAEGYDGSGQAVAVLDTGTDSSHPWFTTGGNRIASEACYSTTEANESNSFCPGGVQSSTAPGSGVHCDMSIDGCDHGTHVAGTVAGNVGAGPNFGVARGADIIAMQVFSEIINPARCGSDPVPCTRTISSDQISALERVLTLSAGIDIAAVNMSLGGGQFSDQASCDAANGAVKAAIDNLRSAGIATVIAAGNDSWTDTIGAPGCISSAISIGATTDSDQIADFSNIYPQIHLLAPGVAIDSALPGGGVGSKQGTSMATPHVAGAWAVLKQMNPGATVSEILSLLQNTATLVDDQRDGGVETDMPRINLDLALGESRTTFGIFNDGPGSLSVTSIQPASAAPWINVDPAGPFAVPVGGLQVVQVVVNYVIAPPGNSQTRLLISSNDPDESPWPGGVLIDITTLATGGPEYSSDPVGGSTLAFGNQQINTESTPMLVEVGNDGTENLTLVCALSGGGASSFNLKACATPVAAQGSTNLSVSCEPASTGIKTALLTVTTNDADEGEVSYNLSCTGTAPPNEDIIHADGFENL